MKKLLILPMLFIFAVVAKGPNVFEKDFTQPEATENIWAFPNMNFMTKQPLNFRDMEVKSALEIFG